MSFKKRHLSLVPSIKEARGKRKEGRVFGCDTGRLSSSLSSA